MVVVETDEGLNSIKKELKVCGSCKDLLTPPAPVANVVPPALLRKIERSRRKRLEREEELEDEFED